MSWNKEIDLFLIFIKEKIIPQKMLNLLCGLGSVGKMWKRIMWGNCGNNNMGKVWKNCEKNSVEKMWKIIL
jgi:hypothetical protein